MVILLIFNPYIFDVLVTPGFRDPQGQWIPGKRLGATAVKGSGRSLRSRWWKAQYQ